MEGTIMAAGFLMIGAFIGLAIWAFRRGLFIEELDGRQQVQPTTGGPGARERAERGMSRSIPPAEHERSHR